MSKKTRNIMLCLYITSFIAIISASTFAYFTYLEVSHYTPEVEVTTATLNQILFDAGKNIDIRPTLENFKEGMGNLSDSTFASAYLKHEEGNEVSTLKYNLMLKIDKNTLTYSTREEKPELILKVKDPNGNYVTNIDGLEYISVTDGDGNIHNGFDITTKIGEFYITKDRNLSTMNEILEKWDVSITYINLSESQNGNYEKELDGYIKIEMSE